MNLKFFPALLEKPARMQFIQQNPDEVIELLLRKHPVTNIPWIIITIVGFFLPFLIITTDRALTLNVVNQLPGSVALELLIMYDLLLLAYVIENFLYWYFNIYIITNQHVVEIAFNSLLNREITEAQYDEIQTVSASIKGVIRELFNYGSVIIETAAKDEPLQFADVPMPDFVADRIRDIQQING